MIKMNSFLKIDDFRGEYLTSSQREMVNKMNMIRCAVNTLNNCPASITIERSAYKHSSRCGCFS